MTAIAYYITGHGFGHARRSVEVVKELLRLRPDLQVYFRTTANPAIFEELPKEKIRIQRVELDPGAIEKDLFTIDHEATIKAVREAMGRRDKVIASEVEFLKQQRIRLILCDIPFMAGAIAAAAGVPIMGITNFTWDWIYEPYFKGHEDLLREIEKSYRRIPTLLKIPFGGRTDWFREVLDIPVIASAPRASGQDVVQQLGLDPLRPRVLLSLRGGIAAETLIQASKSAPSYQFLSTVQVPSNAPGNLVYVQIKTGEHEIHSDTQTRTFSDLVAASSIVLSKLGYGIVADCLAARRPILWPRRFGFREDEVTLAEASPYLPMLEIPHGDLFAGNWKRYLDELMKMPMPRENLATNGASVAAGIISTALG
jgi:L-arabinokinase